MSETSIPVISRVDIKRLAELDKYWGGEGYYIKTISQLVSWSIDLLCQVLEGNGKASVRESTSEAYEWMRKRGLAQPSMQKRGMAKIGTAIRFENLRNEGVKPEEYVPGQFNIANRSNSTQDAPEIVKPGEYVSPFEEDYKKAAKMREEEEREELRKMTEEAIRIRKLNNLVVPSEKARANMNDWELEKKERDQLAELNAPVDLEWLKKNAVKQ